MRGIKHFYRSGELSDAYQKKLITPDEAAAKVQSGDQIHIGTFGSAARDFEAALAKRKNELKTKTSHTPNGICTLKIQYFN